jgi:hypothetical protein
LVPVGSFSKGLSRSMVAAEESASQWNTRQQNRRQQRKSAEVACQQLYGQVWPDYCCALGPPVKASLATLTVPLACVHVLCAGAVCMCRAVLRMPDCQG